MAKAHIQIKDHSDCCGCRACESKCPPKCIIMKSDALGFRYPEVDESKCISCRACIAACPIINQCNSRNPIKQFAAKNTCNDDRLKSSSGGIFIALAQYIIRKGGVVFGAVFDRNWTVYHRAAETMDEVYKMMGSKYIQSDTRHTFLEVREYLKQGRKVLYTGTPCQISGLKHFLKTDYPDLFTVEVICHGVPSPKVWLSYLNERMMLEPHDTNNIDSISFRDKKDSWKKYRISIKKGSDTINEPFPLNDYMQVFLRNWSLRPSCFKCRAKSGTSQADITIGDFWGIDNLDIMNDDDKGISCIICRSQKGINLISGCDQLKLAQTNYQTILKNNLSLENSAEYSNDAYRFQKLFPSKGFYETKRLIENPPFYYKIIRSIKYRFRNIFT